MVKNCYFFPCQRAMQRLFFSNSLIDFDIYFRFCVESYIATFLEISGGSAPISIEYVPVDPTAEQFLHTFVSSDLKSCTNYAVQLQSYNSQNPATDFADIDVSTAC